MNIALEKLGADHEISILLASKNALDIESELEEEEYEEEEFEEEEYEEEEFFEDEDEYDDLPSGEL